MILSVSDIVAASKSMRALIVEPSPDSSTRPVLLFLHGKGESSQDTNELPKVLFHLSPPFRALAGELRNVTVVAPQAPRDRDDGWNWREYVQAIGTFMKTAYGDRRILAVGFSRGGLGVLQLMSAHPGLVTQWAIVDPQRAEDETEQQKITPEEIDRARGWLRFGNQIEKNTPLSRHIASVLPPGNSQFVDLKHVELAQQAFSGNPLNGDVDLYGFLGLTFARLHSI